MDDAGKLITGLMKLSHTPPEKPKKKITTKAKKKKPANTQS